MNDSWADEKAIIDVTIAYTWALDSRSFDDLRQVFAPDAVGDLGGRHCEGIDAIIARIQEPLDQARRHAARRDQPPGARRRRHRRTAAATSSAST